MDYFQPITSLLQCFEISTKNNAKVKVAMLVGWFGFRQILSSYLNVWFWNCLRYEQIMYSTLLSMRKLNKYI